MLRVAICDDEPSIVDKLELCVNSYDDNNMDFYITKFYDGEEIINSGLLFDIVFLTIEMKKYDGIKIAKLIRRAGVTIPIVFISGYEKYWRYAFKVHAFDFIEKNKLNEQKIHKVIKDYVHYTPYHKSQLINLSTKNGIKVQNLDEIYYFLMESKKKIIMYTKYGNYVIKENLCNIYEKIDKTKFYQSHRSCILNLKYVSYVENYDIIMSNSEFVPLAQRKKKEFMERIHDFIK